MAKGKALFAIGSDFAKAAFVLDNHLQGELTNALF
jgi:hypothetical protein